MGSFPGMGEDVPLVDVERLVPECDNAVDWEKMSGLAAEPSIWTYSVTVVWEGSVNEISLTGVSVPLVVPVEEGGRKAERLALDASVCRGLLLRHDDKSSESSSEISVAADILRDADDDGRDAGKEGGLALRQVSNCSGVTVSKM